MRDVQDLSTLMMYQHARCGRCGRMYLGCDHFNTAVEGMTAEEAARVQARYALGRMHNPDHDTTSYRDAASAPALTN